MRVILSALFALSASVAWTAPAFAHAHFVSAVPPSGGIVRTAPADVTIHFTEALEPRFSSIEVQDASGQRVDMGEAHIAPADAKSFIVGLKKLPAGVYTVIWHATSVDTHKTNGSFQFTVRP